ncbi:MAG: serine acetyltransferase [Deltaproteobacteria bacterium]|nr:serine acetyltransferase [Deltaproteobacteria bacterium]
MNIKYGQLFPKEGNCLDERTITSACRLKIPEVVDQLVESSLCEECFAHINADPLPSRQRTVDLIERIRDILFPGYFRSQGIDQISLKYRLGLEVSSLYDALSTEITYSIRHECIRHHQSCQHCEEQGKQKSFDFIDSLVNLRKILSTDVRAAYEGDPAVTNYDEVIFCYPGILAITIYRIAHRLYQLGVPILPRMMTEYAHGITGIDIHPGAGIGESFFIDHGTGVVIGQTAIIGNRVKIYQGVTLGALSFKRTDSGELERSGKRHPTLEDEVTVYAGSTILGGDTVIGARSVVGGNVWLTHSIPPDTKVILNPPELVFKTKS